MSLAVLDKGGPHVTRTLKETVLYYLISGRLQLESGGEAVVMHPGDVHIFAVGEYQRPTVIEDCSYYYLHITKPLRSAELDERLAKREFAALQKRFLQSDYREGATEYVGQPEIIVPKHFNIKGSADAKKLVRCFKDGNLCRFTPKDNFYGLTSRMRAIEIYVLINRMCGEGLLKESGFFNEKTAAELSEYLSANLERHLDGKELEAVFGYSFDYMNRRFKSITGKTIYAYLLQERINQAKLLLYTKSTAVTDVAALTGFNDVYHFSKAFKKMTGITPTEFMRR